MNDNSPSIRQIWRESTRGEKWRYMLCAIALIWIVVDKLVLNSKF